MNETSVIGRSVRWWWLYAALGVLIAHPAQAQTPSPLAEWQYSTGIQLQRLFEPTIPTWDNEVGLGTQFAPVFDGSGRYQVRAGPAVDIRYKDIAFASTGEGIGVNLLSFPNVRAGVAISYDLGRSPHDDGAALSGLGTIHPAPEFKLFIGYALSKSFPMTIRLDIRRQLGATNGFIGDIGAYMPMPGSSEKFSWFVGPTTTVADGRYMNAYFGISESQAASTRYRRYNASGGFKSAGLGLTANYFVTSRIIINISSAFERLLGSAAESPITQSKYGGVFSASVLYKF